MGMRYKTMHPQASMDPAPWMMKTIRKVGAARLMRRRVEYTPEDLERMRETASGICREKPGSTEFIMGRDDSNIAVEDVTQLASEKMSLLIDRSGKRILPGEEVSGTAPFALRDELLEHGGKRSSVASPQSWEEFVARYENPDAMMKIKAGMTFIDKIGRMITENNGKDDYRAIQNFAWPGQDGTRPATITLVGVQDTSARSRSLAARAVYEAQPSALMVQLCRERIGRHLVMPEQHTAALANFQRSWEAGNPGGLDLMAVYLQMVNYDHEAMMNWRGDLAFQAAVDEFMQQPRQEGDMPKVLALGDVRASRLELLRQQNGNATLRDYTTQSARGKQLARSLMGLASMGHRTVVGVVSEELMPTVTTWLERAGCRVNSIFDASDVESGRESIGDDIRSARKTPPKFKPGQGLVYSGVLNFGQSSLGAYINEAGLEMMQRRKQRLLQMTRIKDLVRILPARKDWKVAQLYGGTGSSLPGPGNERNKPTGKAFARNNRLEIPEHYLRDAGMQDFSGQFWEALKEAGQAIETRDADEVLWWGAGGMETTLAEEEEEENDDDVFASAARSSRPVW